MPRDKRILNALKRSEVHRKSKRDKEQVKLKRRMEVS
jgi:ribosome production factor 1